MLKIDKHSLVFWTINIVSAILFVLSTELSSFAVLGLFFNILMLLYYYFSAKIIMDFTFLKVSKFRPVGILSSFLLWLCCLSILAFPHILDTDVTFIVVFAMVVVSAVVTICFAAIMGLR